MGAGGGGVGGGGLREGVDVELGVEVGEVGVGGRGSVWSRGCRLEGGGNNLLVLNSNLTL